MTRYRFANFGGVKWSSRFGFWTGSVRFISQGVAYIVQPMVFIPFLGSFHDSCRLFQIYPAIIFLDLSVFCGPFCFEHFGLVPCLLAFLGSTEFFSLFVLVMVC